MKKEEKKYKIYDHNQKPLIVSDYEAIYQLPQKIVKKEIGVKDFTYDKFKKIADRGPFSLGEWANLLFISERTLHRYAKNDGEFNGLQIERILLLATLIDTGNDLFGRENFKLWVQSKPFSFEGLAVKDKLNTHNDIQDIIDLLERMQQGIPA